MKILTKTPKVSLYRGLILAINKHFFQVPQACHQARKLFEEVRKGYDKLAGIVPTGQYYKYNDHWRFVTQRLCFLAALIVFLEVGVLISKDTCADILGGNKNRPFRPCFQLVLCCSSNKPKEGISSGFGGLLNGTLTTIIGIGN